MRSLNPALLFAAILATIAGAVGCDDSTPVVGGVDATTDLGLDAAIDVPVDQPPTCTAGQALCGGRCVNALTDNANCGACGSACAAGLVCSMGRCDVACGNALATCSDPGDAGGPRYCADLATDRANCGACGNACAPGNICVARSCQVSCVAGQALCGATCRDLQSDSANCGACGTACAAGQVCSAGACAASCGAGLSSCSGACVSTATDPAHCGACGTACALTGVATQACVGGA
ncbi:MAG: hypothetical protein Q8S73_34275, partial [Deltaproteobacteria bacterium]|nr:hypothetical protein [Deltaproteobacteria bacterium]